MPPQGFFLYLFIFTLLWWQWRSIRNFDCFAYLFDINHLFQIIRINRSNPELYLMKQFFVHSQNIFRWIIPRWRKLYSKFKARRIPYTIIQDTVIVLFGGLNGGSFFAEKWLEVRIKCSRISFFFFQFPHWISHFFFF